MLRRIIPCFLLVCNFTGPAGAQSGEPVDYSNNRKISFKTAATATTQNKVDLYLSPTSENESGVATIALEAVRNTAHKLERQKVNRKRQKKAVEMIRHEVESRFLRNYKGLADFSSLFKDKAYNDLTAAALVSMLLEELGIDHDLYLYRQQPQIDLADGTSLQIEQWGRNRPAVQGQEEEQSRLIAVLNALQLAPDNALYQSLLAPYRSVSEKKKLLPAELTGMLYYRRALDFYAKRQLSAAMVALDRARTYYHDPKLDLVHYAFLYQRAGETSQDSILVQPLFDLYQLHPTSELTLELVRRFAQLAEFHLLVKGDKVAFERQYDAYRRLFAGQKQVLQQLKEIYFIEMAQFHAGKQEPHQVTVYLDSLNKYRPHDPKIQKILTPLLLKALCNLKNPEEGLSVVEAYHQKYPFLRNEPLFKDVELCHRAEQTRRAFDANQEAKGIGYLETFERQLAQAGLTPRCKLWITTAYTSASAYYFRNADYINARWLNQRALALVPDDHFLLHRQEVLSKY